MRFWRSKRAVAEHPESWVFGPKRSVRRDMIEALADNKRSVRGPLIAGGVVAALLLASTGTGLVMVRSDGGAASSDTAGASVGVPEGTELTPSGRLVVTDDGTEIDAMDVEGQIWIMADDVRVTRTRVTHGGWHAIRIDPATRGTVIEDSEVVCPDDALGGGKAVVFGHYDVARVEITGCRKAFVTAAGDATVTDTYWNGELVELEVGRDGGDESPPTTDPSPTTTTPPTTDPTPTTTAPGPTTTAPDPPSRGERPGPHNTGPTSSTSSLTRVTGEQVEAMMQPGAVIEGVYITGGNIDVLADDVTIRNFVLDAGGAPYGFRSCSGCGGTGPQRTGFVAEDGEILNMRSAAFWGRHATFRRMEVHESQGDAFKPLTDVTIEHSWWHHLGRREGAHADGVQFQGGGDDIRIHHNFCDMPTPTPPGGYNSNACLIVSTEQPLHMSFDHNWLNGGNYTVYCNDQQGVAVHDNRMGRDYRYGLWSGCPNRSGNVWSDTGERA